MRSVLKRAPLLAAAFLVVVSGPARAAAVDVKVPFPFVVKGQQFPAGEYRLEANQTDPSVVLIRGEQGTTATMFLVTRPAPGRDPAGNKPALTFTKFENQYRLADIWESESRGHEVTTPR